MRHITSLALGALICLPLMAHELRAQSSGSGPTEAAGIFGSGDQLSVEPAAVTEQANVFLLDGSYEAAYDSNPLQLNQSSQPDLVQDATARLTLLHNTPQLRARIEYLPYYQAFHKTAAWKGAGLPISTFNQVLSADIGIKLTEEWLLRVRDDYTDQAGTYLPQVGESATQAIGSPSNLNNTIYTPLNRERGNSSRADLVYRSSPRTAFDLFGGEELRTFSSQTTGPSLGDTHILSGGGQYGWRASEHSDVGVLYMFQHMELSGLSSLGGTQSMDVNTVLPTLGWRPRPSINLEIFGGPQVMSQGSTGTSTAGSDLEWAGGGTVTFQGQNTSLRINAQRLISDGGGLLPFVTSSFVDVSIMRRLFHQWNATMELSDAQNLSLGDTAFSGNLQSQTGSFLLSHRLRQGLNFTTGYIYRRQASSGDTPLGVSFHATRVTAGLSWQLRAIPLGR